MKLGDTVTVSAECGILTATETARVLDFRLPDELAELPEKAGGLCLADLQKKSGVTSAALLSYEIFPGERLTFVALRIDGLWRDRAGTILEIAAA